MKIIILLVMGGSSDNFLISLSFITLFLCFYLNSFFFCVFRHYQYYFRVPPGVRVPQVGNHCAKVNKLLYDFIADHELRLFVLRAA
jgi:hypothetical protein